MTKTQCEHSGITFESKDGWINIYDELPNYDERVLIIRAHPHDEINIGYRHNSSLQHHFKYSPKDNYTFSDVMYWMKLPNKQEFPK